MGYVQNKLGLAIIGALLMMLVAALAGVIYAGPLDPPGTPAPTQENLIFQPAGGCAGFPIVLTSGSWKLAQNITIPATCGDYGITAAAGNKIDLGGFTLQGATGNSGGIDVSVANVTIENGVIAGWSFNGITVSATGARIQNVNLNGNGANGLSITGAASGAVVDNVVASGNTGGYGIYANATNSVITNCTAYNNTSGGVSVAGGAVESCAASGNGGPGFDLAFSTIVNCAATSNTGDGVTASFSTVTNCSAVGNTANGFRITNGTLSDCTAEFNTMDGINVVATEVSTCSAISNFDDGFQVLANNSLHNNKANLNTSDGFEVTGLDNRLDENDAANNIVGQFNVISGGSVVVRNSASGVAPFAIAVGNTTAGLPVGPGLGTLAGAGNLAWGNIIY